MFKPVRRIWPPLYVETIEQRRRYVYRSFIILAFFSVLALAQWLPIVLLPRTDMLRLVKANKSALLLLFAFGMLFLLVFLFSNQVRKMTCLNWMITLTIVECEIMSIVFLAVGTNVLYLVMGISVALIVMVFGMMLGCLMPYDITKNIRFMFTVSFCAFLFSIYAAVLLAILRLTWPFYLFAGVIAFMVLPVVVYHTQYILGSGTIRVSLWDDKLAALLLFTDFLALFMLTFYWKPARDD